MSPSELALVEHYFIRWMINIVYWILIQTPGAQQQLLSKEWKCVVFDRVCIYVTGRPKPFSTLEWMHTDLNAWRNEISWNFHMKLSVHLLIVIKHGWIYRHFINSVKGELYLGNVLLTKLLLWVCLHSLNQHAALTNITDLKIFIYLLLCFLWNERKQFRHIRSASTLRIFFSFIIIIHLLIMLSNDTSNY